MKCTQVQITAEEQTAHSNCDADNTHNLCWEALIQDNLNMTSPWKMNWIGLTSKK